MPPDPGLHVVIVGGGFAGVGCARRLARDDDVHVTLLDRHDYHQFQPLLYQVATSQLAAGDVAYSLRKLFRDRPNVDVKLTDVVKLDPAARTAIGAGGARFQGDALVLAAGSQPNFFSTAGAPQHAFPLYSVDDAQGLRSRVLGVFAAADGDPELIDQGAVSFVIVGGGPTGVEIAGALADLVHETMTDAYRDLAVSAAQIHLVDHGQTLLASFSEHAHDYVAKVLTRKGVRLHLGTGVTKVAPGHVLLSDGTTIRTRCVVWAGGIKAPDVVDHDALPRGRAGRVDVLPDLTVAELPGVYAAGDAANIPGADGEALPQLGSVALQSGVTVAENILADAAGQPRGPFHHHDPGIMATIGRGAAIAEVGPHRHELHGAVASSAWLGAHASLMTGVRPRIDPFVAWASDSGASPRGPQLLELELPAQIDWDDDDEGAAARFQGAPIAEIRKA